MIHKLIILFHYWRAKQVLRFSRAKLNHWQEKHRKRIETFARSHSPFYNKHLGELISKKDMMENFTSFNTRGISKETAMTLAMEAEKSRNFQAEIGDVTVGLSSGTSGNRGLFLVSEKERLAWCGNILAKVLPKAPWRKQKIAFFLRANSELYKTIQSKTLHFAYFDLLEDVEVLRGKLTLFAPDVLVAPPSMLLQLKNTCRPSRVVSVAETLLSPDEKVLEEIFGQKIFQVYQCTEGFLGFTCPYGTLHFNEDLLKVEKEYLDEQRFIPILTDLFRRTQPILRYRLDDVLVEKKSPCPCGCSFLSLERIEGRCDDLLYAVLPTGKQKPIFPDFISRKIAAASEDITDFEVVQTEPLLWEIYLNCNSQEKVTKELQDLFTQLQCVSPKLVFVSQKPPQQPGAKRRRIRRAYANP